VAWSKPELLAELRRRASKRQQLGRGLTEGLRRQFGSLAAARALAGIAVRGAAASARPRVVVDRGDPRGWSRDEVIARLQAWSVRGGRRMRGELAVACKHHFGSVARACTQANVSVVAVEWTADRIQQALRERGFDVGNPAFVAACIHHFGSVTAARASIARRQRAWSKAMVIAELQARAQRGLQGVGRLLRDPAVRLFGSTEAALQAAAQAGPRGARRRPGARASART